MSISQVLQFVRNLVIINAIIIKYKLDIRYCVFLYIK